MVIIFSVLFMAFLDSHLLILYKMCKIFDYSLSNSKKYKKNIYCIKFLEASTDAFPW